MPPGPVVALPVQNLNNAGTLDIDLALGFVHRFLMLELTVTYTTSDANGTAHQDLWGAYIERIQCLPAGVDPLFDVDGYSFLQVAQQDCGGPLLFNTLPVASGANTGRCVVPMFFELPDAANPLNGAFDPRGLASFKLRVTLRNLTAVITGTTVTAIAPTIRVTQTGLDGLPLLAGNILERRIQDQVLTIAASGDQPPINLKRGGTIRRIHMVTRTAAPLTGARSDGILNRFTVARNTNEKIVDSMPWYTLASYGQAVRDYVPPTGVGIFTFDPEGTLATDALLPAEGSGLQTLELQTNAAAAGQLVVVPEFLVVRG